VRATFDNSGVIIGVHDAERLFAGLTRRKTHCWVSRHAARRSFHVWRIDSNSSPFTAAAAACERAKPFDSDEPAL
jgi:hypothetical protein